jgi:hypothetical protein
MTPAAPKQVLVEKPKPQPKELVTEPHQFEKYFLPLVEVPKTVMKHKYTVEITRAVFSEESYLVFEKY